MTVDDRTRLRRTLRTAARVSILTALSVLASCGGSLGNPPDVNNGATSGGQKLSYAYFQRCIDPIFFTTLGGNQCGSSGCHAQSGTGGALRVLTSATVVDVTNAANTADVIRATDMYKNFVSAQAQTLLADPAQSRLINKPLVRGVLHGGGVIFASDQDPNVKLIEYWITHPSPQGQDEFSQATWNMFVGNDPINGQCKTQ